MEIRKKLAQQVGDIVSLGAEDVLAMLETPPDTAMGDAALPCFKLAKTMRKAPPVIAEEILSELGELDFLERAEVQGGYLNFFYNQQFFVQSIMEAIMEAGEDFGKSDMGKGKPIVIDYSSINIAKPFHIGHLSSTAIGGALYKIYKYLGYETVGVNHLGDWGTQFGKLITAYKHWGDEDEINAEPLSTMLKLYVKIHEEEEKDESLLEESRGWFKKIEDGDEEALRIFNWFKELTLNEVQHVYDQLNSEFDSYAGESFYNDKIPDVIAELEQKNLLEESEGAYVVRLDEEDLPPAVIVKTDGTSLYMTRDLAAARYRKETYDFYKSLYVVAYQQNLHFKQLFAVLKKMGYDWADQCEHIAFGMVSLEDGTLSTRRGKVVLLEDVLKSATDKTLEVINDKNPDLENKEKIAQEIGVGAVVYSTLSQSRIKDITFSFDRVLNFEGETGPYVQYTHARCCSVIERAGQVDAAPNWEVLCNEDAIAVIKHMAEFPKTLIAATEQNEPFYVTRNITELAQAFNKYYYEHKILDQNKADTAARVAMTAGVRDIIKRGLALLGIAAPEKM